MQLANAAMRLTRAVAVIAAALALMLTAGTADAYPQFQLSSGNSRCSDCHFSPTGGGLINEYGRGEAGDTISRGGNGAFLHGAVDEPDWLKVGFDARFGLLLKDASDDPRFTYFPMQADVTTRFSFGDFSATLTVGPRATPREPRQSFARRMVSREHYLMWQPNDEVYVRAGRFTLPYGIRTQDHTLYVRRFAGLYILEETYNVGAGYLGSDWEFHANVFVPADSFTSGGPRESGGAALYERVVADDAAVVGGGFRLGFADASARYMWGGFGKYYFEDAKVLVLGEVDLVVQDFNAPGSPTRGQLLAYLGATWWPTTGVMLTPAFESYEEDLKVDRTYRDAYRFDVQYFPVAHFEVQLTTKIELQGSYSNPTYLAFLQLHYYL